jgi:lipoprotein signal peptidase
VTIIVASVCFAISICVFLSTNNQLLKAIGLALIIFGLTGLVIDYFSKERAEDYYKAITKKIDRL